MYLVSLKKVDIERISKMFTDNVYNLFPTSISNLEIQYLQVMTSWSCSYKRSAVI